MKATVYIETSIVSYLAARPNRDLISAARQQLTMEWWAAHRDRYDLYSSELVVAEARAGHPEAAARRLALLDGLPLVEISESAVEFSEALLRESGLPEKARADAVHIAAAAFGGMEFLLTWNMRHIANAELRPKIDAACRGAGYEPPTLCTPDSLMSEI